MAAVSGPAWVSDSAWGRRRRDGDRGRCRTRGRRGGALAGWLAAFLGSVPAACSAPSVQPSWSVSASRGCVRKVCSTRLFRPSLSGFSDGSRSPSPSLSSSFGRRPGVELEAGPQPIPVLVLPVVAKPVAIRVRPPRVEAGDPLHAVRERVLVGILARVGQAVAIRVRTRWVRQGPGPLPIVREAVSVRVGDGRGGGRRDQAGDDDDGSDRRPGRPTAEGDAHRLTVGPARADGNASVVPTQADRGPVPAVTAGHGAVPQERDERSVTGRFHTR